MRMKRRIFALLLAGAMTVSLCQGCAPETAAEPAATTAAESTAPAEETAAGQAEAAQPSGEAPLIEIPQEYRSWDESGDVNYEKLNSAENGMVAALRYEAAEVGNQIMEEGGTAVDAAVATALALTVTLPHMCSVAGGGFMTFYSAQTDETVYISFREVAPMFQTAELWVQDEEGSVIGGHNMKGGLAAGVPGEIKGLYYALEKYGTMEWADVVQPAIDIARGGFTVTPELREAIAYSYDVILENPETAAIYLDEFGLVPEAGTVIHNDPLAKALEIIRDKGPEGLYSGQMAEAIVSTVQHSGGVMTLKDLENYECWEEEPVSTDYRGYKIFSSASPSSGGTFIIEILNILENLPVQEFDSVEYWHQLAEVQKMVWADRGEYMGDTRFMDVPIDGITSKEYAAELAKNVDMTKAQEYTYGNPWNYEEESQNTTSFCVADKAGNMVAITHTINSFWGCEEYVDGYGFFLNNQLGDFVVGSGYSNSVEPGKCPLSSMSPTVVFTPEGKPFMTCGAPGGINIYPCIAQVIVNTIDYGMNVDEALNTPRIAARGNEINYSIEFSAETLDELKALGHEVFTEANAIGFPTAIMYMEDGTLQGSAEDHSSISKYSDGVALGF